MAMIPRLNYQHLLYFWSVVRTGSLARACDELALSPPTISAQLRTLEERLGEKLLVKSGRILVPTDVGRLVFSYAEQIFGLGQELIEALEQRPSSRPLRLIVGIDDVLPKEVAYQILETSLQMKQPVRMICREGTLERLLADLAVHEIDVVLSDAAAPANLNVRVYNHLLGHSKVYWMATPTLAKTLRRGFPKSLDGVWCCCPPTTPPYAAPSTSGCSARTFVHCCSESSRTMRCCVSSHVPGTALRRCPRYWRRNSVASTASCGSAWLAASRRSSMRSQPTAD